MKYLFIFSHILIFYTNSFSQVKTGDKYNGVVKLTTAQAKINVNGKWDVADHTGNAAVDTLLNRYVSVNKNNPKAIAALESVSSVIRSDPAKYINPDGSVNTEAMSSLLKSKFAGVQSITIPPPSALVDSNTNKGMR